MSQLLPETESVQLALGLREPLRDLRVTGLKPGRDPKVLGGGGKILLPGVKLAEVSPDGRVSTIELDGLPKEFGSGHTVAGLVQRPGEYAQGIHH